MVFKKATTGNGKMKRSTQRLKCENHEPSMTKQSFKDECNINKILAKFQRTGAMSHYANHAPTYGNQTSVNLLDAQLIIANANTMFEELPSSIRKKFGNDPGQFLDFVQDEKNHDEMVSLGLKPTPSPLVQTTAPTASQSETPSGANVSTTSKEGTDGQTGKTQPLAK